MPVTTVFVSWLNHALWQGAVLGVLLVTGLRFVLVQRTRLRYAMSLVILSSLVVFPLLAAMWPFIAERLAFSQQNVVTPIIQLAGNNGLWFKTVEPTQVGAVLGSLLPSFPWQGLVSTLYLVGVATLSLRFVAQLRYLKRLRQTAIPASTELTTRLQTLSGTIGLPSTPSLAFSSRVDTALVLGWRRPLVLLPVGLSTKLTSAQLDGVLTHELAHVKRRDYAVNLFQCLLEILFFYHPVAWWASKAARLEREACCDDLTVQTCGTRLAYAEALIALERQRIQTPLTLAVGHGDLTVRVQRLLGQRVPYAYPFKLMFRLGLAILLGVGVGFAQGGTTFFRPQVSDNDISSSFSTITYGDGFEIVTAESLERYPLETRPKNSLPFDLYLPTKLPESFASSSDFFILQPQNLVLTGYSAFGQPGAKNSFLLQQQPVATFRGQPVGASARVQRVLVGGNPGEYVEGHWSSREAQSPPKSTTKGEQPSSKSTNHWVNGGTTQMLVWQQDDFVFTLRSNRLPTETNSSKRQAIIQIAKSLASANLRP